LVGVTTNADRQPGALVDSDAFLDIGQHVRKLVPEPSVADAQIVCEAEGPCPFGHHVERFAK
jgi:hypothetical protein